MIKSTSLQLATGPTGTGMQVSALPPERGQERAQWVPELQLRRTEFGAGRLLV